MEQGLLKYIIRQYKVSKEIDKIKWIKTRVLKIAAVFFVVDEIVSLNCVVEGCFLKDWD